MENPEHSKEIYTKLPTPVLEAERTRLAERIAELSNRYHLVDQVLFERTTEQNYGISA